MNNRYDILNRLLKMLYFYIIQIKLVCSFTFFMHANVWQMSIYYYWAIYERTCQCTVTVYWHLHNSYISPYTFKCLLLSTWQSFSVYIYIFCILYIYIYILAMHMSMHNKRLCRYLHDINCLLCCPFCLYKYIPYIRYVFTYILGMHSQCTIPVTVH